MLHIDAKTQKKRENFMKILLGLILINAFEINETQTGRKTSVLHSFYEMDDNSCIAFFEAPDQPFVFKDQHDFDLHIALEVSHENLIKMFEKVRKKRLIQEVYLTMDLFHLFIFATLMAMLLS